MLRADSLWFAYDGAPVVRGVSLDVPADGFVGILGPNGSGKTTLLRLLAGMRAPDGGCVSIDGVPLLHGSRAALARRMAVVPQETHLAFDYRVVDVVLMGRYAHLRALEIEGPGDLAIARDALAATGTLHLADRPFATLSGGEKQRVVVAAAVAQLSATDHTDYTEHTQPTHGRKPLPVTSHPASIPPPSSAIPPPPSAIRPPASANRPPSSANRPPSSAIRPPSSANRPPSSAIRPPSSAIRPPSSANRPPSSAIRPPSSAIPPPSVYLLLDEPTASLDLKYQLEIAALLRALHRQGIGIILSTHDLSFASSVCRTLVLVREGRVLASGAVDRVLTPARVAELYDIPIGDVPPLRMVPAPAYAAREPQAVERAVGDTPPVKRRLSVAAVGFGGLMLAALVLAPLVGSTTISLRRAFDFSVPFARNTDAQIFFIARLPRTLAGAFVGITLATAGVVFQGLLRNPLATPFTLGVSAGAALGAMLAITFNWSVGGFGLTAVPIASFIGSAAAVAIVYGLSRVRRRGLSTEVLLLAGVTLNAFLSALILFVQYFANFADTYRILRWLMGDLDISGYGPLLTALPLAVAALAVFAWIARPLNLLSLGPDSAEAHGLDVTRTQRAAFLSASLATGAAVSVGGPIGFIGIIVPHLVRLIVGSDHRVVLPASAFFGGAFLIACDVLSRTLIAPVELPVGIITALIGGPFFLWLLIRHR